MSLLRENPVLALFLCLGLGYLLGKLRVGPIQLGGICGTLIVSLLIGSKHVTISGDVKTVAFALFIFSLGYMGGPQFFANLNAKGARFGVLCVVEFGTVIGIAYGLAKAFNLDVGTAAGILAGAATESAVVGTAQESIAKLNLPHDVSATLQNNVATAYSVCYLFGLVTIVLLTSQIMPMVMRINLKDACREIWDRMRGDDPSLEPDEQAAMPALVGRTYQVVQGDGRSVAQIEARLDLGASVEALKRGSKVMEPTPELELVLGDLVLIVGQRDAAIDAGRELGPEAGAIPGLDTPLTVRDVVVTNKAIVGKNVGDLEHEHPDLVNGVYLTDLLRVDHHLAVVRETEVHRGDVLTIVGPRARLNRVAERIGSTAKNDATDYVYLSLGIALGVLIGTISVKIGGIPLTLGTGGGCLISGLLFGWLRAQRPTFGGFPTAAAQTIKDLGLSIFIAVTGLTAGADAWALIKQYGALLPLAGIGMVLIPAVLSMIVGLWLLKIDKPILIGAIAGQQCSTPAITSISQVAQSTVPLLGYTITYTISNFLLPLSGPLLVGFLGNNPGH